MIDSKGRTYIKIYCCGDCVQYNWRMHRCKLGAHVDGTAGDCFYLDCPYLKEEKEHTWIPVSERLPEPLEEVLVTSKYGHVYTSRIVHGEFEYGGEVIAWMPLPKPYEGDKE